MHARTGRRRRRRAAEQQRRQGEEEQEQEYGQGKNTRRGRMRRDKPASHQPDTTSVVPTDDAALRARCTSNASQECLFRYGTRRAILITTPGPSDVHVRGTLVLGRIRTIIYTNAAGFELHSNSIIYLFIYLFIYIMYIYHIYLARCGPPARLAKASYSRPAQRLAH